MNMFRLGKIWQGLLHSSTRRDQWTGPTITLRDKGPTYPIVDRVRSLQASIHQNDQERKFLLPKQFCTVHLEYW